MRLHTSYKVGGPADFFVVPHSTIDVEKAVKAAAGLEIPYYILGGGSNILVADKGIDGMVIDTTGLDEITVDQTRITAQAGAPVSDVSAAALRHGLSGLEFVYYLPGTVGGAVFMNARCYGKSMCDVLLAVTYLSSGGELRSMDVRPEDFAYKSSPFQTDGGIILTAQLKCSPGNVDSIRRKMEAYREDRSAKGHFKAPSCGSVFKNNRIFGEPSGKIIDSLGLKGYSIGGAQVAPFHGNIIINTGGASAADIRSIIEFIQKTVLQKRGFKLEPEVQYIGRWG